MDMWLFSFSELQSPFLVAIESNMLQLIHVHLLVNIILPRSSWSSSLLQHTRLQSVIFFTCLPLTLFVICLYNFNLLYSITDGAIIYIYFVSVFIVAECDPDSIFSTILFPKLCLISCI